MISYLQAENLTKSFGDLVLFENISFGIGKEQKIALIAKNGTGKTTLLNIIMGFDTPDSGNITQRNGITIGYLPQSPLFDNKKTVIEQVFASENKIVNTVREYEAAIQFHDKNKLQAATEKMDALEAWDYEAKIKQILAKLNITEFDQPVGELSGGQKKRLALANVLINEPDLIILDEPTNHLDLDMIEWLENYLLNNNTTLLMVTHDRYFLDKICNEIIELEDKKVFHYRGNYAYYLEKREDRITSTNATIDRARQLFKREKEWINRTPSARGTKSKSRIDSFYKVQELASQKMLQNKIDIEFQSSRLGNKIIDLFSIYKSFGDNNLIDDFTHRFQKNEKIGILGKNGCGKSTLLNIITGKEKQDAGKIDIGETVVMGFYQQAGIELKGEKRVIEVIKEIAEIVPVSEKRKLSASQFLEYFLFNPEMHYNYVSKLSGGERRRLYLMTILLYNPNFLILDEPTNDLDIMTLNVLEDYLINFEGCTLIVSHDRYFLDKVVDTLFIFEGNGKIKHFPGNYTDYKLNQEKKNKLIKKEIQIEKTEKYKPVRENQKKVSFKDKKEFEAIENEIQALENEKFNLEQAINSGTLKSDEITVKSIRLHELINLIDEKEMRWLELSEMLE
jgi:ATP-binding cassette subfamily F protein uup